MAYRTGRTPTTDLLALENAGIEVDGKGYIKVDKFEMTTQSGIYAIGDVTTTGYELTPVAIAAVRSQKRPLHSFSQQMVHSPRQLLGHSKTHLMSSFCRAAALRTGEKCKSKCYLWIIDRIESRASTPQTHSSGKR